MAGGKGGEGCHTAKNSSILFKKKKKERKDLPKVTELVTRELGYECRLSGSNTYQLNL